MVDRKPMRLPSFAYQASSTLLMKYSVVDLPLVPVSPISLKERSSVPKNSSAIRAIARRMSETMTAGLPPA